MTHADGPLVLQILGPQGNRELLLFRRLARSLLSDAEAVVEELCSGGDLAEPPVQERLHLLAHYLDYLIRLCDGQV